MIAAHFNQVFIHQSLFFDGIMLQLQVEILSAQNIPVQVRPFQSPLFITGHNQPRDFPSQTGRRADNPLPVLCQQFMVNTRFIVKTICVGNGNQFNQVMIPLFCPPKESNDFAPCCPCRYGLLGPHIPRNRESASLTALLHLSKNSHSRTSLHDRLGYTFIPISRVVFANRSQRIAPSNKLYSLCTWRCTKG